MGIQIFKVNPPHIKLYNQYVECCCTEEEKERLLTKLKRISGVTYVMVLPEDQGKLALRVFFVSLINNIIIVLNYL